MKTEDIYEKKGEDGVMNIKKTNVWLKNLEQNFMSVVIGGTDGTVR